jgi:hypothetical protein
LRAIAERDGSAGFSEIKNATGLSTGSIYYHLERMKNYVIKDSKQYKITEEGLELLREIDKRHDVSPTTNKQEDSSTTFGIKTKETIRQPRPLSQLIRDYSIPSLIVSSLVFASVELHITFPTIVTDGNLIANTTAISPFLVLLLVISLLVILKKQMLPVTYTGSIVSL